MERELEENEEGVDGAGNGMVVVPTEVRKGLEEAEVDMKGVERISDMGMDSIMTSIGATASTVDASRSSAVALGKKRKAEGLRSNPSVRK